MSNRNHKKSDIYCESSRPAHSASVHLIVQYYRCTTSARQAEIDACLRNNLDHPLFTAVHVLTEEWLDFSTFAHGAKIRQTVIGRRLTYEQAFRYANEWHEPAIWIVANADIYFDDSLDRLSRVELNGLVYALTRHDVQSDGSLKMMDETYSHGSQDAWIFQTPFPIDQMTLNFNIGTPGCDNRLVYELVQAGFKVLNPSLIIRACHLDLVRNASTAKRVDEYLHMSSLDAVDSGQVAPPPYLGEIYPTDRLATDNGVDWTHHQAVLRDFASHVQYIETLRVELKKQKELAAEQAQLIQQSEQKYQAIQATWSWRVTAPLRRLSGHLFPPDTLRLVFFTVLAQIVSNPLSFIRIWTRGNIHRAWNYLSRRQYGSFIRMIRGMGSSQSGATEAEHLNWELLKMTERVMNPEVVNTRLEKVDVIIPVFNGYELTVECLKSVLANSSNCRVIVVDDASPDGRIRPYLDTLRARSDKSIEVMVMSNDKNLGFVRTVNLAVSRTSGHFVILNSDTEVPPGWLERLMAPIERDLNRVASVTPFSNAGMDCSYPLRNRDNPIDLGLTVAALDRFFARYSETQPLEIFSGVGFCMAFNRRVVEKIGMFDAETFERGYGEECDWSLRAHDAGYRNVIAPNLFVYHKHGGSFTEAEKKHLLSVNQDRFWRKQAKHLPRFRRYISEDVLREVREAMGVVVAYLSETAEKRVAILDVDMKGGGTLYSTRLARSLAGTSHPALHLKFNASSSCLKLRVVTRRVQRELQLPLDALEKLDALLKLFEIDAVLVNELFTWPDPLLIENQLHQAGLPYIVFIHDYFVICPSQFLLDKRGNYCGVASASDEKCSGCLNTNEYSGHHAFYRSALDDVGLWRGNMRPFLQQARSVMCFSEDSRSRLLSVYDGLDNISVNEHFIPEREHFVWRKREYDGKQPLRIAMLGYLFHLKGETILGEMVAHTDFTSLPVTVTVFGNAARYPAGYRTEEGKLSVLGQYQREELEHLLESHGIHMVMIPSICPETFSYTTSEAMLMGYPVICFDLGAQAERVRRYDAGIVVSDITGKGMLAALRKVMDQPAMVAAMSERTKAYSPPSMATHVCNILRLL